RVVASRRILPVVSDAAKYRVRSSRLNGTRAGRRNIHGVAVIEVGSFITYIIDFERGIERQLPLQAKTPMLVVPHGHVRVASRQARSRCRAANGTAYKEGRHGAQPIVEDGFIERIRNHVMVHAIPTALDLVENTVTAAQYRL